MNSKCYDAIIVGGGSVGVPTAYNLAKQGLTVLVIEKRATVGQGENKAAIGGIRATHSDPAKIILGSRSLQEMSTWKETHGIDVGFKTGGYAFPVYSEQLKTTLTGLFPLQHRFNLKIDWISKSEMQALIPGINSDGLLGGTYSPNDGQLSPLKVSPAFMTVAKAAGAEFKFKEQVISYQVSSGRITGVTTDKGSYSAPRVIIASGSDAKKDGILLGIDLPIEPDSHEAGITAPVAPFLKPLVVDLRPGPEGKTANFYFGQNDEGQILFCYTPKKLFKGTVREPLSEFLPILASRLIALLPRAKYLLVRRIWRGCYPMTPDGVPIIDNITDIEGLTVAVGMCGQGFMLGPGVGQEVASLVIDGKSSLPQEAHDKVKFSRDFNASSTEALK